MINNARTRAATATRKDVAIVTYKSIDVCFESCWIISVLSCCGWMFATPHRRKEEGDKERPTPLYIPTD